MYDTPIDRPPIDRPMEILLVEDNPGDVRLTREALREGEVASHLHVAGDGEAALECLRRLDGCAHLPRPDLVLLDLNLPRKGGHEVLAEIKADPLLRGLFVVVLSMSKAEADIHRAYELEADCYVVKPIDLDCFIDVINHIERFWFTSVRHLDGVAHGG